MSERIKKQIMDGVGGRSRTDEMPEETVKATSNEIHEVEMRVMWVSIGIAMWTVALFKIAKLAVLVFA